jgi:hypothetical protein
MRRPPQRYVPIGKQVRLGMTAALRSLRSTTVDETNAEGDDRGTSDEPYYRDAVPGRSFQVLAINVVRKRAQASD